MFTLRLSYKMAAGVPEEAAVQKIIVEVLVRRWFGRKSTLML
jgi:hypothetical protein